MSLFISKRFKMDKEKLINKFSDYELEKTPNLKINVNTVWNIKMAIVVVNHNYVMILGLHQKYQKKK